MNCKCRRCRTETSVFWYPFAVGCGPGSHVPEDGKCVLYLCDSCAYELSKFLDIDLYMLKERIQ